MRHLICYARSSSRWPDLNLYTLCVGVQVNDCTVKLQRADKLIGGLGGERVRWQATVDQLGQDLINVIGDVVIAAGSIAYSGGWVHALLVA